MPSFLSLISTLVLLFKSGLGNLWPARVDNLWFKSNAEIYLKKYRAQNPQGQIKTSF